MRKLISVILSGSILLLCSCGRSGLQKEVTYPKAIAFEDYYNWEKQHEEQVEDKFIASVNNFSYTTAQALMKNRKDNFNYSPLSLYYALSLAGTGARGETQQQIFKSLGVSSEKELSSQCCNLYRMLYSDNNMRKLKIANSLWMDSKLKFNDSFVANAADNFYASAYSVDFSANKTSKLMSEWIAKNTNNTLQRDMEKPDPEQILSIINTVYFYGEWRNIIDEKLTKQDIFHAEGKDVKVNYMNETKQLAGFIKGDNYTKAVLCMKAGEGMIFILPDKGVSVQDLISDKGSVQKLFKQSQYNIGQVVWKIPKFKFGTTCKLNDALQTLGISNAFSRNSADFSGITDTTAFIKDITQKTHIGIDEKGVEASAYTELLSTGANFNNGKAEMILDRPFIYGVESAKNVLLFVGVCNDPSVQN